jgi:crotonobetainyl-CoA:carnitine CoA-transferase CaiB-like acyl-CoA transferase
MSKRQGQPVRQMETALSDTAFSLVAYQATATKITGKRPPRAGSGNPIAAPYEAFRTRDGELLVAAPSQRLWELLTEALEAPELRGDPRFATALERVTNREALNADLARRLARETKDFWIERLRAKGIPVAEIIGLDRAVEGPIAQERQTFSMLDGIPLVRLPWTIEGRCMTWTRPAPRLGEHTDEVLTEIKVASSQSIPEEEDQ